MASAKRISPFFYAQAVVILLAGFALRAWNLGRASLWVDEIITDEWVRLPVGRIIELVLGDIVHMPLYFITLRAFPTSNELLIRLPSVWVGLLSIALLMGVTQRLYHAPRLALWSGALLACNPLHVWLSRTARPYALLLFVSLLASAYFLIVCKRRSRFAWGMFTLTSATAYTTHFFGLMLPLAQAVYLAVTRPRDRRFKRNWIGAQVIAALPVLLLLPGLVWVYAESNGTAFENHVDWIPGPRLIDPLITLSNLALGYDGQRLVWWMLPGLIAASVGLVAGVLTVVRKLTPDRSLRYWLALIVGPLTLVYTLSLVRPLIIDRYFIGSLPAVLLVMLAGWQNLPGKGERAFRWLAASVVLTGAALVMTDLRSGNAERVSWRDAADFVVRGYRAGDAVLLNSVPPFEHYFERGALATAPRFGELNEEKNVRDVAELPTTPGTYVWAIYANAHTDPHRQGAIPFDPFAQRGTWMADWLHDHRNQIIEQRDFNGVTVFLLAWP